MLLCNFRVGEQYEVLTSLITPTPLILVVVYRVGATGARW